MARYDKLYLLGSGSYGKAWVVETQDCPKELRVLKEIRLQGLEDRDVEQAVTEVAILARCKHKNIISYTEAFISDSYTLSIVMEYASGGDVHKEITKRRGLYFPNEIVGKWFSQLLSALEYIHNRGILHRDLKPQNLFLTDKHQIKLGDFGISRILHDADVANTLIGTPFYLSPEICKLQPHCDEIFQDIVASLLNSDPEKRPSASDILKHPTLQIYFKGISPPSTPDDAASGSPARRHSAVKKKPVTSEKNKIIDSDGNRAPSNTAPKTNIKQMLARKIDTTTYTVVRHPKLRRLSLASPELSAMLEKQRSQSLETQRALSVDAPQTAKTRKQVSPPRMSLLRTLQKSCEDEDNIWSERENRRGRTGDWLMERLTRVVYQCVVSKLSAREAAQEILTLLQNALGHRETEVLLAAVKRKTTFEDLQKNFDNQPGVMHGILWYLKLVECAFIS